MTQQMTSVPDGWGGAGGDSLGTDALELLKKMGFDNAMGQALLGSFNPQGFVDALLTFRPFPVGGVSPEARNESREAQWIYLTWIFTSRQRASFPVEGVSGLADFVDIVRKAQSDADANEHAVRILSRFGCVDLLVGEGRTFLHTKAIDFANSQT
ncbi:MAG: hypothetical protein ABIJ92_04390 [Candidatus Aenigmatarchaeota archaeon]